MPYAVKSDNGTIGYIIPVSRILDFLASKTENIEKYTAKTDTAFAPYIKSIQALYKNPNSIQTSYVEIKNAEKNGFTLVSAISSMRGDIFSYYFLDKNSRVALKLGCSQDASITWKDSIQYAQDALFSQQNDKSATYSITGSYTDASHSLYSVEGTSLKETK